MIWDSQDENDSRIHSRIDWFDIKDYKEKLSPKPGVYLFADDQIDIKYIGKAGGKRMVVESDKDSVEKLFEVYSAIYRKKDFGATKVKALYTYRDSQALKLEGDLIRKYNPPNNGVDLLKS